MVFCIKMCNQCLIDSAIRVFPPVPLRLKIIKTTNETKLNKNEYESENDFLSFVGCCRGHRVQVPRPRLGI